jgi:ABC-type uncharacterized transport system involved in gliding motility auxiliary subunit
MASRKLSFNLRCTILALVLLAIFVLLNAVISNVGLGRFDVTEDRIYTISPGAKKVFGELKVPVTVKFYVTGADQMPAGLQTLERDVVDKLSEFNVVSDGNLRFSVVDPSKDDDLKEKLATKGIRPFQVQSIERDAMGIKLVYSALEIAYLEKEEEVLPQVLPQTLDTLEYDIAAAVTRLTRDMDPVIGVYASRQAVDPQLLQMYMQMGQSPPEPQDIYQDVVEVLRSQSYDVRRVEITKDSPIPEEASTLLVLAPRNLSDRQRYEINRFVQRGGNLVVAVQKYEFNYTPGRMGGFNISASAQESGLDPLLKSWGLEISDRLLMDSNNEVLAIPSSRNVGGLRLQVSEPVQAPMQIKVTGGQINDEISVANGLDVLLYLWGSRLVLDPEKLVDNEIKHTVLFHSSAQTWEVDYTPGPLPPSAMVPDPDGELSNEPLGVYLEGILPNAYAEGTVPPWGAAGDDSTGGMPVEEFTPLPTKAIVVGCAKMFDDSLLRSIPSNAMLMLNAVDALTLGDELIQIRAKATTVRSIDPLSDQAKLFYRFFSIVLVPLLVAAYGVLRMMKRRREEAAFLATHGG